MTVTKGKQKYSFPSSTNNSDTESLHLGGSASNSDVESLHNEPISTGGRPLASTSTKPPKIGDFFYLKKCAGRKKQRRYQNRCVLHTLAEEDEDDEVVIMEPYKTVFAKLLEDKTALEYWDMFVNKSEDEQAEILENYTNNNTSHVEKPIKTRPFSRISPKIRRTIKVRKNLPLETVKKSEDNLVEFFKIKPKEIYSQAPSTYFERLLIHAIAQYHGLQSLSVLENGARRVDVFNTNEGWTPADCFLADFVAELKR